MRYLKYTYVDAVTGIPVSDAPATNGPKPPAVAGLVFGFALESHYPTNAPVFYGTADADAEVALPGVMAVMDEATFEAARVAELADRDRKRREKMIVSRFQARAALHLAGLLEAVETLMQSPDTPMLARLAWQDAQEFKRQSPTVLAMASALNLSDADLDQLFITAAGIDA